ncbi:MAG: HAMP domain-containing histidine kinase [Prevotella sp.]|nr:HAMP domain-containing histidine kinase [Prevotella sp.]
MTIGQTKNRVFLLLAALLLSISIVYAEGGQDMATEDQEEARLKEQVNKAYDTGDEEAFMEAAHALRSHYQDEGRWHDMFTMWEEEVIFDINNDHFYSALKKAEEMNDMIVGKKFQEEFYRMDYLMGVFYGTRENIPMCKRYLNMAIDKIEDKSKFKTEVADIYLLLANILSFEESDSAIVYIDKCISLYEKKRSVSVALQMKCIIEFARKDRNAFMQTYNRISKIKLDNPKDYESAYDDYVEQGMACFEGRFDDAIALNEQMVNRLDALLLRTRIYEMKGDKAEELEAVKALFKARQQRSNEISTMEINDISHDINMQQMRHETRKATNIAIVTMLIGAVLAVLYLVHFLWSRSNHLKKLKAQNLALMQARDKAQEADRMKTAFIRNASHQIRTPLNAVSGFSTILAKQIDELSDQERQDLAQRIEHSASIITNSLNHLIALSDIESTDISDRQEVINCHEFCRELSSEFKPTKPSLLLKYTSSVDRSACVKSNRQLLKSIITEILVNANKFTEEGSITLGSDMTGGMWQLSVTDTGKGILPDDEEKVFGQFTKIDDFSEGLGLGLTFCKTIAHKLGGDVVLDTSYHDGARFIVQIPA